jgi:DNA repair exonuclease SbcCD nuclease subunit
MRIGILGDLHLTNMSPKRRMDDYWKTLCRKLSQALQIFDDNDCDVIVQVGDFFDSPTVARRVSSEVTELLYCFGKVGQERLLCVWGQHDVSGHSKATLPNSPLVGLQSARVVKILSDNPVIAGSENSPVYFYGASFGESVPKVFDKDAYSVLVTHRMIGDRRLWPDQVLPGPKQFLRKHSDYNLILAGDYHYRFTENCDGRTIINPGAIVRKTIGKFDLEHKPAVVVFDTDTSATKVVELDIGSVEKVFDLTSGTKKQDNTILKELVKRLKEGDRKLAGWKNILVRVLEETKSSEGVRKVIDETLEELRNG